MGIPVTAFYTAFGTSYWGDGDEDEVAQFLAWLNNNKDLDKYETCKAELSDDQFFEEALDLKTELRHINEPDIRKLFDATMAEAEYHTNEYGLPIIEIRSRVLAEALEKHLLARNRKIHDALETECQAWLAETKSKELL